MAEDEENMEDFDSDEEEERVRERHAFLARFLRTVFYERPNGMRNEDLLETLKENEAISDPRVEQAFLTIPREYFVTPDLKAEAYNDHPLRFSKMGFNISAPHMHAMCLSKMNIQPGNIVLDIGSGSGHLTVLAGYLTGPTGAVHGLDLHDYIIDFATKNLNDYLSSEHNRADMTFDHVSFMKRNCFLPSFDDTKYDRIHVGACCPESHIHILYDMLKPGGIVVTPFGDRLIKATKDTEDKMHLETLVPVRYSDLILPSDAEIKEAHKAITIAKASTIVIPLPSLETQFANLLNNPNCSDLTLVVEGKKIHAHKTILQLRSERFRDIVNKSAEDVKIDDCSYNTFMQILTFIYTDKCLITNENVEELKALARLYKISSLITKLEGVEKPVSLLGELGGLVNNALLSDVGFVVGDKQIPGHRLVLEVRSEHFQRLFSSGLRESQSNRIDILDCSYELFLDMLRFIYTDQCNVTEDNCIPLLEQANFFQLDRLKAICESFWFDNININNAASVLEVADRFNATQLKDFAMEFIFKNIKEVVKTPGFQELDQGVISSILIASVERSK